MDWKSAVKCAQAPFSTQNPRSQKIQRRFLYTNTLRHREQVHVPSSYALYKTPGSQAPIDDTQAVWQIEHQPESGALRVRRSDASSRVCSFGPDRSGAALRTLASGETCQSNTKSCGVV